jgi:hypothetical protein
MTFTPGMALKRSAAMSGAMTVPILFGGASLTRVSRSVRQPVRGITDMDSAPH